MEVPYNIDLTIARFARKSRIIILGGYQSPKLTKTVLQACRRSCEETFACHRSCSRIVSVLFPRDHINLGRRP
jgi:hypothetical protein